MTTFYCPRCWRIVEDTAKVCPYCDIEISRLEEASNYESRLISALAHTEPQTAVRAAHILGDLLSHQAVPDLLAIANGPRDVYLRMAAVEALGRIGDRRALPSLAWMADHGPQTLRPTVQQAMDRIRLALSHPPEHDRTKRGLP
jgi:hypothetical protein